MTLKSRIMKKTILSFLLIGSAAAVMAQQPATPANNSSSNTNRYNNTSNTNLNNNNSNLNNSNLNNNQNTANPNPVNNSAVPPTNAGRDTSMSNNGNQVYDNSATGTPYQPMNNTNQTLNGSNAANTPAGTMAAYNVNVPSSIRSSFTTNYPSVTGNSWSQSGDWYVTRYVENGTIKLVSFREDGKTLTTTAAPVRSTFVSDDAMSQAIQKYGANVYSVNTVRGANGQDMYAVRVIENGQARTIYMNQDGSVEENYYRTEENAKANLQTGQQQQQVTTQHATQPVQEKSANGGNIRSDSSATPTYNKQQQQSNMNQQQMESPKKQNQEYDNNSLNKEGINNASDTTAPKRKDQ